MFCNVFKYAVVFIIEQEFLKEDAIRHLWPLKSLF